MRGSSSNCCNIDHDFDLRCGRNNCMEFRSWAAPTADCCVTLPQDPLAKTVDVSAITEQIPEVNATEQATVCSNGGECDHPANSTGLMAWNVMVADPRTNIEFSFNITNTNGRNWKRGKKIKKKRNGRKKKRKKGKRSRGRKMRKQGVKRDSDDECPEGGWVMIAEGEPKRTNPHVILNRTCLPSLRSRTITAFSNRVQVYFQQGTGQKTHFELTAKASDRTEPAKCLDDCKWKENEFSQTTFWRIGGWNVPNPCSGDDAAMCVRIQFTMSFVPEELSCLNDCFSHLPKEAYKKKCTRGIQLATTTAAKSTDEPNLDQSDDKDIDCILFNRMPEPKDRSDTFSLSLIPEIGQRRRKSLFDRQDPPGEADAGHFFSNFLPTEPLDRALIFCIMANLDARSKLLSPNKTGEFHSDDPIWSRNETCSAFLPKLDWLESVSSTSQLASEGDTSSRSSSGPKRRTSKTRSSGPSSAIIER